MKISKQIKCLHCNTVIKSNGKCICERIYLKDDILITEGVEGKDYTDMSPKLLNE